MCGREDCISHSCAVVFIHDTAALEERIKKKKCKNKLDQNPCKNKIRNSWNSVFVNPYAWAIIFTLNYRFFFFFVSRTLGDLFIVIFFFFIFFFPSWDFPHFGCLIIVILPQVAEVKVIVLNESFPHFLPTKRRKVQKTQWIFAQLWQHNRGNYTTPNNLSKKCNCWTNKKFGPTIFELLFSSKKVFFFFGFIFPSPSATFSDFF